MKSNFARGYFVTTRIGSVAAITLYAAAFMAMTVAGFRGNPYSTGGLSQHHMLALSQSLQHFMAALAAFMCFWIAVYHKRHKTGIVTRPWLWIAVSAGFLYATYDKMLDLHEKADVVLFHSFPWLPSGHDVFTAAYGLFALVSTVIFLKELRPVPRARRFYVVALCLFLVSTLSDYVQAGYAGGSRAFLISSIVEETSQYIAGTTFALAFFFYALDRSWLALMSLSVLGASPSRPGTVASEVKESAHELARSSSMAATE